MGSVLLDPVPVTANLSSALQVDTQLQREVLELRAEVARYRRENLELRQQAGYWKSRHADAVQRLAAADQENERLRGENRKLQDQQFGKKSEKHSRGNRSNQLDDPDEPKRRRKRGQQPGRPGPKRRDYSHLPICEDTSELPEAERICPHCSSPLIDCGAEVTEQIEIETVIYRKVLYRRRYQRTCNCSGQRTFTAPMKPKLLPRGRLGVSVWVEILVDKFASHRPTERLLKHWKWLNLDLAAGTVADGLQRLEPLFQPIYEALLERLRNSPLTLADETRWRVFVELKGKVGHNWWLWVFSNKDTVAFVIDPSRSHDVPEKQFSRDAHGVLLVDRFSAYKAMIQVTDGLLWLAFCWAHVRRDFVSVGKGWPELKTWSLTWLKRIRELYILNRQRLKNPADTHFEEALRQAMNAFKQQVIAELADPSLREPCRKVLISLQVHEPGLWRFVADPQIPMDNNLSERLLRGPAMGRKNYYGSGAIWSGRLAAAMFSILATLQLGKLNPRLWLQWYLESCAEAGGKAPPDIQSFLPWNLTSEKLEQLSTVQKPITPDSS